MVMLKLTATENSKSAEEMSETADVPAEAGKDSSMGMLKLGHDKTPGVQKKFANAQRSVRGVKFGHALQCLSMLGSGGCQLSAR